MTRLFPVLLALTFACGDADPGGDDLGTPPSDSGPTTPVVQGGDELYGDCAGDPRSVDEEACDDDLTCVAAYEGVAAGGGVLHVCIAPCGGDGDCEGPPEGDSVPECREIDDGLSGCVLACSSATICPAGSECAAGICAWR